MAIIFKLTTAGRQALVNAAQNGTAARTVASVGVTATAFTPTEALAAVPDELKRITAITGDVVAKDTIHVTMRDDSNQTYTVRGLGLYLDNGVLLGTYSQAAVILEKSAPSIFLLSTDLRVLDGSIDISTLQFGETNFINPPATTERQGVVELATSAEVLAGTDDVRAITPAGLAARTATDTRQGIVELATPAEVQAGTDAARAVTPAGLTSRTATDTRQGIVELATPAEVQAGTDTARAVTPAGLVTLTASDVRQGLVELATAAEVQAGTDTARAVTPAGLAQRTATETRSGVIAVATQAEVNAGTVDTKAVTPKKLRAGFAWLLGANGYIAMPTWLGGLIFQWGEFNDNMLWGQIAMPIAMPTKIIHASAFGLDSGDGVPMPVGAAADFDYDTASYSKTNIYADSFGGLQFRSEGRWFAIGY